VIVHISKPGHLVDLLAYLRRNGYRAETVSDSLISVPDDETNRDVVRLLLVEWETGNPGVGAEIIR
jgi:hypothetical protein